MTKEDFENFLKVNNNFVNTFGTFYWNNLESYDSNMEDLQPYYIKSVKLIDNDIEILLGYNFNSVLYVYHDAYDFHLENHKEHISNQKDKLIRISFDKADILDWIDHITIKTKEETYETEDLMEDEEPYLISEDLYVYSIWKNFNLTKNKTE